MSRLIKCNFASLWKNSFVITIIIGICVLQLFIGVLCIVADGYRHHVYRDIKALIVNLDDSGLKYVNEHLDNLELAIETGEEINNGFEKNVYAEHELFMGIKDELVLIDGYQDYIQNIIASSDINSDISIFQQENNFSQLNIKKTKEDYMVLKNTKLHFQGTRGHALLLGNEMFTVILFFNIVFIVMVLLWQDRKNGLDTLYISMKYGRIKLGIAKIFVMIISMFIIVFLNLLITMIIAIFAYGGFDLMEPIQSFYGYQNSVQNITIGMFFVYLFMEKWMAASLVGIMIACIASVISYETVFVILSISVYVFFRSFNMIPDYSSFVWLKYVNPIYMLDGTGIFFNYYNLSVASKPLAHANVAIVVGAVVFLICCFVFCVIRYRMLFHHKGSVQKKHIKNIQFVDKRSNLQRTNRLLCFELYKSLIGRKQIVVLGVVLILFSVYLSQKSPQFGLTENYYKKYMKMNEGKITDEVLDAVEKEKKLYDQHWETLEQLNMKYNLGMIGKYEYDLRSEQETVALLGSDGFDMLQERLAYVKECSEKKEMTPWLVYDEGWKKLLGIGKYERKECARYDLLVLISIIITSAGTVSSEYESGMQSMLSTYKNGRIVLKSVKRKTGYILMLFSMMIVYTPLVFYYKNHYGLNGVFAPACSIPELYDINGRISILMYSIMVFLIKMLSFASVSELMLYVSKITKNTIKTIAIGLVAFVILGVLGGVIF